MSAELPPCPASLKSIAHYLKTAQEHDARDVVVAYWCRLYALQTGLKLSSKQPEETALFLAIMGWLESTKKQNHENESITNEIVAQAYLENYAMRLFSHADQQDRASNFNKNLVKAFYTAGMIYDVLLTFGELSEEANQNRKYAKYKAAYIHNCLKSGETPIPGPHEEEGAAGGEDDNNDVVGGGSAGGQGPSPPVNPPANHPAYPPANPSAYVPHVPSPQEPLIGFTPHPTEINPEALPSPPPDPEIKNPGGFQPYTGPQEAKPAPTSNAALTAEQMSKAGKYCKWAQSALNFDDVSSAVENLQKALHLLTTGQEMP